jgi:orotate phosphoribosyltransferase
MNSVKNEFIQLAMECAVLRFGEFTLKSGRISPYFFNAGLFYQGTALLKLGKFYAQVLIDQKINFQHLFGPAYKGIPLVTATAIALAKLGVETTTTFNRKEVKAHGEGGSLIGAPLTGNTVIIDDVITAGTAFREAKNFIMQNNGKLEAVVIALDRGEYGVDPQTSALEEIRNEGIGVYSIISFCDLVDFLRLKGDLHLVEKLNLYHERYGFR